MVRGTSHDPFPFRLTVGRRRTFLKPGTPAVDDSMIDEIVFQQDLGTIYLFRNTQREPSMSDVHSQYNEVEKLIDDEKFDQAIDGLKQIVGQDDSFVLAHLALSRVYTKTGQHDLAIQHGEQACALEPTDPFNFTALSVTYQRAWAGTQEQQYIAKAEEAMAKAQRLQSQA